jgi:hypothetical protein
MPRQGQHNKQIYSEPLRTLTHQSYNWNTEIIKTKRMNNSLNSGIKKWTSHMDFPRPFSTSKVQCYSKFSTWSDNSESQDWWQTHHLLWGSSLISPPPAKKNHVLMFLVRKFHSQATNFIFIGTDEHHTGTNCYVTQYTLQTNLNFTISLSFC